ncbi:unnamed protein product [Camellia sinensis]
MDAIQFYSYFKQQEAGNGISSPQLYSRYFTRTETKRCLVCATKITITTIMYIHQLLTEHGERSVNLRHYFKLEQQFLLRLVPVLRKLERRVEGNLKTVPANSSNQTLESTGLKLRNYFINNCS